MKLEFNFVKPGVLDLPETDWWVFEREDLKQIKTILENNEIS
jgi:hypothetical protein